MRILEVKLSNFGPHTRGLLETDAALIGIVGPNGSGKSNVMSAIKWALTSQITGTVAEYIKDFDPSKRQPSAKVELKFVHQGVTGRITRTISKSGSTRELEYDGKISDSEAEVESRLCAIYGDVALRTIADVGFIAQDEMQHLLFGLQSEREKMFVKLFGLSHTDKVAQILQDEIRLLRSSIADRSAQISTVEQMLDETRRIRDAKSSDFLSNLLVDTTPRVAELKKWIEFKKTGTRLEDELAKASESYAYKTGEYGKLMATLSPDKAGRELNLNSLRGMVATAQSSLRDRQNAMAAIMATLAAVQRAEQHLQSLDACEAIMAGEEKLLASFDIPLSDESGNYLAANSKLVDTYARLRDEKLKIEKSLIEIRARIDRDYAAVSTQFAGKIEGLKATISECEDRHQQAMMSCHTLRSDIAVTETKKIQLQGVERILSTLSHSHSPEDGHHKCPVCRSNLSADAASHAGAIRDEIADIDVRLAEMQNKLYRLQVLADSTIEESKRASKSLDELQSSIDAVRARMESDKILLSRTENEQLESAAKLSQVRAVMAPSWVALAESSTRARDLQTIENAETKWKNAKSKAAYTMPHLEQALSDLVSSGHLSESQKSAGTRSLTATLATLRANLTAQSKDQEAENLTSQIRDLEKNIADEMEQIKAMNYRLTESLADAQLAGTRKTQAEQALAAHSGSCPPGHWVLTTQLADMEASLVAAEDARDKYIAARAELSTLDEQAVRHETELNNLRALDQTDQNKRDLATKLEHLQGWFKREGLPLHYVQRRFDQITQLTNMSLEVMGSNFRVTASTEKPVTFLFSRTDRTDGAEVLMSQNRLSGGQRVRLSIAFLIGFHELVVPGFGLMSLDEPSLHLDNDSVNDMRDLLVTMGRQIEGVGRQIILCDHNPHLVSACEKVIAIPQGGLNH